MYMCILAMIVAVTAFGIFGVVNSSVCEVAWFLFGKKSGWNLHLFVHFLYGFCKYIIKLVRSKSSPSYNVLHRA